MCVKSKNRLGIILQARIGSTRLPGKVLMTIGNKALLDHILYRLKRLRHSATPVIATSETLQDNIVESFCIERLVACFRGSEANVLDRYYQCAKAYGFEHIVRLTGDNPFPDIEELDNLIDLHLSGGTDYANSFASLPVGVGAEIFTFASLEKSWREGKAPHHLEHVNEYLLENPQIFKTALLSVAKDKNRPDLRLTVDTMEDYEQACYIAEKSHVDYITTKQAIDLAEEYARKVANP
jgi:spore coat polysaccharide biosynthesis protein SpsF